MHRGKRFSNSFTHCQVMYSEDVVVDSSYFTFVMNWVLKVRDICYRPPGTELNILNGVNLSLREKRFFFSIICWAFFFFKFLSIPFHKHALMKSFCVFFFYSFCSFGLIFGKSGSGKTTLLQVSLFPRALRRSSLSFSLAKFRGFWTLFVLCSFLLGWTNLRQVPFVSKDMGMMAS